MAAAAHNPEFAHKVGIPQSVAQEFNQADAGTGILQRRRQIAGILAARKKPRAGY